MRYEMMNFEAKSEIKNPSMAVTNASLPYVTGRAGQKNYYENDYLSVTPMMQEMFADKKELQPPDVFERPELLSFEEVSKECAPKRKLTTEEFNALPAYCKNRFFSFLHNIINEIFPLILMLIGIIVAVFIISQTGKIQPFPVLFGLIFFAVGLILGISDVKNTVIKPDSMVSVGNVVFFTTEEENRTVDSNPMIMRIGVGFYDDKKFVKKLCQIKSFNKIDRDTKVLYFNKKLLYFKDGKFYLD